MLVVSTAIPSTANDLYGEYRVVYVRIDMIHNKKRKKQVSKFCDK